MAHGQVPEGVGKSVFVTLDRRLTHPSSLVDGGGWLFLEKFYVTVSTGVVSAVLERSLRVVNFDLKVFFLLDDDALAFDSLSGTISKRSSST